MFKDAAAPSRVDDKPPHHLVAVHEDRQIARDVVRQRDAPASLALTGPYMSKRGPSVERGVCVCVCVCV